MRAKIACDLQLESAGSSLAALTPPDTKLYCFMRVPNFQSRGQMVKGVLEAYPNKTYVVVQGKAAAAMMTCDSTVWCDPLRTRLAPQQELRKCARP